MKNRTLILVLLVILLLCLLPAMTLALKTEQHVDSVPVAEGAPLPPSAMSGERGGGRRARGSDSAGFRRFPRNRRPLGNFSSPSPESEPDPCLIGKHDLRL